MKMDEKDKKFVKNAHFADQEPQVYAYSISKSEGVGNSDDSDMLLSPQTSEKKTYGSTKPALNNNISWKEPQIDPAVRQMQLQLEEQLRELALQAEMAEKKRKEEIEDERRRDLQDIQSVQPPNQAIQNIVNHPNYQEAPENSQWKLEIRQQNNHQNQINKIGVDALVIKTNLIMSANHKKSNSRVTMDLQGFLSMLKEDSLEEELKKQQKMPELNDRMRDQINRRVTLDIRAMNQFLQDSPKEKPQPINSVSNRNLNNRVTLDLKAMQELLLESDKKYDRRSQSNKGSSESQQISSKMPVQPQLTEEEIIQKQIYQQRNITANTLEVARYFDEVDIDTANIIQKRCQVEQVNAEIGREIEQLSRQLEEIKSKRKQSQNRRKIYEEKVDEFKQNYNLQNYQLDMKPILYHQVVLNTKILKFEAESEKGNQIFYGEFILDTDIYIKIKRDGKKADMRITHSVASEYIDKEILFDIKTKVSLLKNYFSKELESKTNLYGVIEQLSRYYKALSQFERSFILSVDAITTQDVVLSQNNEKLTFKIASCQDVNFLLIVHMSRLLEDKYIDVYRLETNQEVNFKSHPSESKDYLQIVMFLVQEFL